MATEGYCVKCKAKRVMNNEEKITMKNGRPATKGVCPNCGTKMFKIGK
jgi:RNase P subunit RPR2